MSYVFNESEERKILDAVGVCDGMTLGLGNERYQPVAIDGRNCVPFYQALSNLIDEKLSVSYSFNENVKATLKSAKLWLDVAIDANGGRGAYSALIRAYTVRQGQLRLHDAFSAEMIQKSSNGVAVNFVNSLIHGSAIDNLNPWTVPLISQIASIDARAVGEILFRPKIGDLDTASRQNSGWSGTIAFSLLGGEPPYETWRLISAGDPGSEIEGNHAKAKVNRLDDFKNILFAIDSYNVAVKAVIKNIGQNTLASLFSLVPEQINVALSSGSVNPLIQYVVKGTPISPTVDLMLRYGINAFFDMFRRTYEGESAEAPTTDETFAENAYAFFSKFSSTQSQSIVAKTIGEYGSASQWAVLASQKTPIGQALRNSLKYLSEIVIEREDGFPGRELELYDSKTGVGVITEQWLIDRADMLGRLIARTNGSTGENTAQTYSYSDMASGSQAPMMTGVLNPLVMFGDDGGRSFTGGPNNDHLYGGAGNDTINGLEGNDYVEGGRGRDSLTGGEGRDTLQGMSGDDALSGGQGNDVLIGGVGSDRYEFSSGDGVDQIVDFDVDGQILINGLPIPALKRSGPLSNTWITEDGAIALTLIEGLSEKTLHIKYGQNDLVFIKHFAPGMLGIHLPDYQRQDFSGPDLTVVGDWKVKDADPTIPGDQLAHDELGNVLVRKVKQRNKADVLHGSLNDDVLIGLGGSDQLFGKAGNDRLFGDGQLTIEQAMADGAVPGKASRGDWLDGGQGEDLLVGTGSRDVLLGGDGRDTLIGGAGDDNLSGDDVTGALEKTWNFKRVDLPIGEGVVSRRNVFARASLSAPAEGGNDILFGQGGSDFINGGWGDDLLDGGTENDVLSGDGGNDTLHGGNDNDILLGDNLDWGGGLQSRHHGNDLLDGGDGDDALAGNGGSDVLYGGLGNDDLTGDDFVLQGVEGNAANYFGSDFLDGGAGNDTLQGGGADDSLYGGAGNDVLSGDYADHPIRYHGNDLLDGGAGDDTLRGMGGADTLIGGQGADALDGDEHGLKAGGINDDYVQGDAGNDTLWGGLGADTLYGGADDDFLIGDNEQTPETEQGADYLDGGSGNDTLIGGGGNDTLYGGGGVDYLRGGSGNNVFSGGTGNDYLDGADGDDTFFFGYGDGLDVIADPGGNNIIKFGSGFTADNLKAEIIVVDMGRVLRLSNGLGDAVLLRDHEKWQDSSFGFTDGTVFSFQDVMKIEQGLIDVGQLPSAEVTLGDSTNNKGDELAAPAVVVKQLDTTDNSSGAADENNVVKEVLRSEAINGNVWEEEFLKKFKERRAARRLASGFVLNDQGAWVATYTTDDEFSYSELTSLIDDNFHAGVLAETTPQSISSISGRAVFTERSLSSTPRSDFKPIVDGLKYSSTQKPQYHPSGSSYNEFSLKAGDIVVENKDASGGIKGWYVYPAGSFNGNEITNKKFSWEVVTDKVWHKIVRGDDSGGRVNLEVGNVFHGGAGDDLIVTYKDSMVNYGSYEDSIPGAFLSGGAGDDTLLGAEGADYLVSGSGEDWLYGENGPDTYIVGTHGGATSIIADIVSPVFRRSEVGAIGWQDEFGVVDTDTVILPEGVALDQLQLAWGAALIEAVNIELATNPLLGTYRNLPRGQMLYSTLDISWGKDQQVRIVLPNTSDFDGSGVEVVKFADGSSVSLEYLIGNSKLGPAPDVYRHGVLINSTRMVNSARDNKLLPLVGGRGNDSLSGNGEICGMRGNDLISGGTGDDVLRGGLGDDTLYGGAGNDIYKYDGLGRDVIVNTDGGIDGVDFSEFGVSINQLRFHRDNDDLVIVVNYGASPKIRIFNHFIGGDAAVGFVRVQGEDRGAKDYTANQIIDLLHPLPPLRDVEDILLRNDDAAMQAMVEIIKFYQLQG